MRFNWISAEPGGYSRRARAPIGGGDHRVGIPRNEVERERSKEITNHSFGYCGGGVSRDMDVGPPPDVSSLVSSMVSANANSRAACRAARARAAMTRVALSGTPSPRDQPIDRPRQSSPRERVTG